MRKYTRLFIILLSTFILTLSVSDLVQARGRGGYGGYRSSGHSGYRSSGGYKSSSSGSKTIKVKSYYRKDGTYVPSHYRSASHSKTSSYMPSHSSKSYTPTVKSYKPTSHPGVQRDSKGHIKRSSSARKEFMKQTGYPNGRPGYVIDHIVPLKRGGADSPENMQWQTIEEAKAKDKVE